MKRNKKSPATCDIHTKNLLSLYHQFNVFASKLDDIKSCALFEIKSKYSSSLEKYDNVFFEECLEDIFAAKNDDDFNAIIKRFDKDLLIKTSVCKYCGIDTTKAKPETVFGSDHISCALKSEVDESKSSSKENVESLKNRFDTLIFYMKELEKKINELDK